MKKIMTLAMAILITSAAATAGNNKLPFISFGLKLGIHADNAKMAFNSALGGADFDAGKYTSYEAGLVLRLDLPVVPIYFQPEIVYNWGKVKENATLGDVSLSSFQVPVMIGVGFGASNLIKLRANLGPVFNLTSTAKIGDSTWKDVGDAFKKPTVSWAAGIGIDVFNIMFDVRYNGVFSKKETSILGLGTATYSPRSWSFTLGYLF